MKPLWLALSGLLLIAASPVHGLTFTANPNAAVPDNDPLGFVDSIDTSAAFGPLEAVLSVHLEITMTHTRVGHLAIELVSPDGTELQVLARPGSGAPNETGFNPQGDGSNLVASAPITFRDGESTSAEDLGAAQAGNSDIPAGAYFPDADNWTTDITSFAGFVGETAGGVWQLKVADYRNNDTGTLVSWSLVLVPEPATGLLLGLGLLGLAVVGRRRTPPHEA